jgi:hypothetical protein
VRLLLCLFLFTPAHILKGRKSDHEETKYLHVGALPMTKVRMNINLLAYQMYMKDSLQEVIQRNYINGAPKPYLAEPPFTQKHLLVAPSIGFIALDGYMGQGDDYIGFVAAHDFGIHSMHITILDDQGHVIESGQASPFLEDPNGWEYLPQACVPSGTTVTVQITAVDCMGGIGRAWESKTLEEEWP